MIKLHTNFGVIGIEVDADKAPLSAKNFIDYVAAGHYDRTIFHRVIPGFMVQVGGFAPGMKQKPCQAPIRNEADNGLKNDAYTVAMARTADPHSATAQFFINVANNDFLNFRAPNAQGWGYCVFGKVVGGTEVVDVISKVAVGSRYGLENVPLEDVVLKKAEEVQ